MEQEFDYEKYIWQIQFRPWYIVPREHTYKTIIDCVKRTVTVRRTITNTYMVNERIYDFEDDENFEELLSYSEIAKIHEFESLSDDELRGKVCGYRDGWGLKYSYFTHEVPPRIDGFLGWVYWDSPFEKITEWLRRNIPDENIKV